MKKYYYVLLLGICASSPLLHAKIGCMDNSWHLQKKYDSKEYHYVACDCPCTDTIANRNQCPCCDHYHDAEPWVMITSDHKNPAVALKKPVQRPENALQALKKLVMAYKQRKN